jgi:hypothetical protein
MISYTNINIHAKITITTAIDDGTMDASNALNPICEIPNLPGTKRNKYDNIPTIDQEPIMKPMDDMGIWVMAFAIL